MPASQAERTELEWLEHDGLEMRRLLTEDPKLFEPLADFTDPRQHTLHLVIADLFWQVWYHAMAVEVLLTEQLETSAVVVQRALYEAIAAISYIHHHQDRAAEAEILLASTYLKQVRLLTDQPTLIKERQEILARIPGKTVKVARERLSKKPFTWSGKSIRAMMSAANVTGYDTLYAYLSAKAH